MNQVQIAGFVGSSPEISEKTAVFNVAVRLNKEKTMWCRCVAFSEFYKKLIKEFIEKGSFVCVGGSFELSEYEKDGVKSWRFTIYVEHLTLGPSRSAQIDFSTGEIIEGKKTNTQGSEDVPY